MKSISVSGGATKFVALASAVQKLLHDGYVPGAYIGVSSGSIVSYFAASGMIQDAVNESLQMRLKTIWSRPPINSRGKLTFTAYWNIVRGKNYLSKMNNLRKMLEKFITKESHWEYRSDLRMPMVYVMAIDASTKERKVWNLKEVDHVKVIDALMASSTIPGMGEAVNIDGRSYYDGGLRDQNAGAWLLKNHRPVHADHVIDEVVSIYSRPEDYVLPPDNKWRKNLISLIDQLVLNTFNIEVSKNDEQLEFFLAKEMEIKLTQVFINPFVKSLFDVNRDRLLMGYKEGINAIERANIFTDENE